jgi:hypothetical protein
MAMAFLAAAPTKALAVAVFNFSIITPRGKHTSAACASVAHKQHGTVGTPRSLRACAVVTRQVPTRNACQRKVVFGKGQCFGNAGGALRVGSTGTARLQVRVVAAAAAHASSDAGNAHRPNAGNAHNTKQHWYKYSYGPLQSDPPLPRLAGALGSFSRIAAFIVAALLMLITRAKPSLAGAAQSVVNGVVEPVIVETVKTDSTGAVIGTVVLLVVYGFFAISETAITTLWPWKVREISDQEGPDSPFTLLRKDITRFLTTILIGSTFSSIGSAGTAFPFPNPGTRAFAQTKLTLSVIHQPWPRKRRLVCTAKVRIACTESRLPVFPYKTDTFFYWYQPGWGTLQSP